MKNTEFIHKNVVIFLIPAILASTVNCGNTAPPPNTPPPDNERGCALTESTNNLPTILSDIQISIGSVATRARFWPAPDNRPPRQGIIFVSGVDGGYTEPADNIYTLIAERYSARGVASVFVQYREPGILESSIQDAMAGAAFLRNLGVTRMAIVGWSFGGAVIIHTATQVPEINFVMAFAPQAKDTEPVGIFRPDQSLLLFHSDADENVPFESSQIILNEAPPFVHKELHPIQGANHILDGEGVNLAPLVFQWLENALSLPHACS